MAEVKNAFIKSKMNKDLDSRLLPSGEYRDGFNIQVSKSEGEDVGALENALGNSKALINKSGDNPVPVDFSVLAGHDTGTLKSIGLYSDIVSSTIFVFLTNYTDPDFPGNISYSSTALNYIYSYNTLTTEAFQLVSGAYLNFSKTNPINAVNTLENLLFWTDNRNQPRKININTANGGAYYISEDLISVAKYNPYSVIELYYQDTAAETPYSTQDVPVPNPNLNQYVSSSQDVTSQFLPGDGTQPNMYYDPNWPGDPDYLKNKFVSFSYRFKFSDGEYSILAPFTQEAFIPQQDGYFLTGDEDSAYRSSIIEFMRNKVTNVKLHIPLPIQGQNLESVYDVSEIEIVWKQSDSLAVKILDSIPSSTFVGLSTDFYSYDYQSRKPYKTLPESEIIRVYDKVPVRALSQEIISNRVVYGNFQDKHTPPSTINYDVAVTEKSTFNVNNTNTSLYTTSEIEYPEHTLKQNRNYQVGIVLSDRYGRQSTTILSPIDTQIKTITSGGNELNFKGSTYYHPYKSEPVSPIVNDIHSWPGDSLKILVNAGINSVANIITGTPGLWNGDPNDPAYNPLGWYSYKVVVKQTETDYYNVYLPGILNDYPDYTFTQRADMPDPINTVAHISLISDNINKVPRDLTEVGPEQLQYRSDVKLFGRVTPNFSDGVAPIRNEPYYPKDNTMTVVAISEQNNMFIDASVDPPYSTIYQTDSDPYIARISQNNVSVSASTPLPKPIGSSQVNSITGYGKENIFLGVFETAPVESLLDIFYETSTTGLISDFNLLAGNDNGTLEGWNTNDQDGFIYSQTEASDIGATVVEEFTATLPDGLNDGAPIANAEIKLVNVSNGEGTVITSDWLLEDVGYINGVRRYNLNVVNPKYFETTILKNTFIFTFSVINKSDSNNIIDYGNVVVPAVTLGNIGPIITNAALFPAISADRTERNVPIFTFLGTNGTIVPSKLSSNLSWEIENQVPTSTPPISINPSDGQVFAPLDVSGNYSFDVIVTDSGNLSYTVRIGAVAGKQPMNPGFGKVSKAKNISKGIQSTGFFWCNNYSTALDAPYQNDFNNQNIQDGRTASISALKLTQEDFEDKALIDGRQIATVDLIFKDFGVEPSSSYRFNNLNYTTAYLATDLPKTGENSLTEGTAFIKIDFKFKQWPYQAWQYQEDLKQDGAAEGTDKKPFRNAVTWTAYLEYRATNGSWVNAVDIEGNEIKFGSTQLNINQSDQSKFFKSGILNNATKFDPDESLGTLRKELDSVGAEVSFPQQSSDFPATATVSKIFAIGEAQSYENIEDKFGDYRLLILYPVDGGQTEFNKNHFDRNNKTIPSNPSTGGSTQVSKLNTYGYNGAIIVESNIRVDLSYGDFYYPNLAESNDNVFVYRVSPTGYEETINDLFIETSGWITVYAREWALKYVTQFFTNSQMTQKWVPLAYDALKNYYVYESLETDVESTNSAFGSENSAYTNGEVGAQSGDNDPQFGLNNVKNFQRKYKAQFDINGKKIKTTAVPLVGNLTDVYEPYNPNSNGNQGAQV